MNPQFSFEILQKLVQSEEFKIFSRIYKETASIAVITAFVELIVGIQLLSISNYYTYLPGLLLIIPGIMENRGNVISNLAQRLGSSLHLGIIGWDLGFNDELRVNLYATIILNVSVSIFLAFLAFIASIILNIPGHMSLIGFLTITLFMSLFIGTALTCLAILVVLLSHKLGLDPDNVTIPTIATIGDSITIASLFLAITFVDIVNGLFPGIIRT